MSFFLVILHKFVIRSSLSIVWEESQLKSAVLTPAAILCLYFPEDSLSSKWVGTGARVALWQAQNNQDLWITNKCVGPIVERWQRPVRTALVVLAQISFTENKQSKDIKTCRRRLWGCPSLLKLSKATEGNEENHKKSFSLPNGIP